MSETQTWHAMELFTVAGRASEEDIASAEHILGVRFPSEYREFLARFGAAYGMGRDIAGLFKVEEDVPPEWIDLIQHNASNVSESDQIAISGDGMDTVYYLNTSGENLGKVVAIGPGVDGVIAESFIDLVSKIASGEV